MATFTTALLFSLPAQGQPNRRDLPLRTPKGAGVGRLLPGGKAPRVGGGPAGKSGSPRSGGPPGASGSGGASGKPGAKKPVGKAPDIAYKPLKSGAQVNLNMSDVDLTDLVETISNYTGRRFIFGGKLRSVKVTIVSPKPVRTWEAYQAFLSVLETHGMTVVPHGRYLKIVETTGISKRNTPILGTRTPVPYEDRFVTRLYRPKHVDAGEVADVLGKFKTKDADITVYAPSNLLLITDTGTNIRRMLRIVEELDSGGAGEQIWMHPVHYQSAADMATKLSELLDAGQGAGKSRIIAEERNNLLIIVATESDYLRLLELIKRIDVPLGGQGSIHVLPLQHSRCDELSQTLSQILGSGGGASRARSSSRTSRTSARRGSTGRSSRAGGSTAASGDAGAIFEAEVRVVCDEATNSLVTTSSLRDYARLRAVIDKLDQPRRQVFIEAVIMDVNVDRTTDVGLGFHGGATSNLGGGGDTVFYGGSNPGASLTGIPSNLEALAFGIRGPDLDGTSQLLGTGVSIPGLGVVLHALSQSGDSNVLATPHILATDNIPAEISIGQNIPLQTNVGGGVSQLASLAGAAGGSAGLAGLSGLLGGGMGFQAPRQDVGIKLKIVPHINDSDQVRMEITEEFSDAGSPVGALGAVPINKRTADTTVIVRDQQTVVIGGLVRESQINGVTKVPVLGDIPVLGILFRTTKKQTQKTNLLLILTPHIVRNQDDLRRIFERKMQERQEFLDRYFVFDDTLPWEPLPDYSRSNGLLEHIRQTQLKFEARELLAAKIRPSAPKTHEPVQPIALPSIASPSPSKSKPRSSGRKAPPKRTTRAAKKRPKFRVPGGRLKRPKRYRIE